jgi:putative transposase
VIARPRRRRFTAEYKQSITVDNGTEFASKAMDLWAYTNGVHLYFIRPGRPVENGYIESVNGKLRGECLNVEVFFTLADDRRKCTLIIPLIQNIRQATVLPRL